MSVMHSFWQDLPRPFTILAPMQGVTDVVFRNLITEIGKPDVLFTEFTNVEGLQSRAVEKVKEALLFTKYQKPIVAQLWGIHPNDYYLSAKFCKDVGFDGIDINMGCPDKLIVKRGSCAALIKNPDLAKRIIEQTKKASGNVPVSVKTRLGFEKINLDWIVFLLEQEISSLTIHLRTVDELSKVPAHWEVMHEIVKLRDKISPSTILIGNGDIQTYQEIQDKYTTYGNEGFMIGRGIFQNPFLFNKSVNIDYVTVEQRIALYIKHIKLFDKTWKKKNPALLKKFCKTYLSNFEDATSLREKIMLCSKTEEMLVILKNYKGKNTIIK